jgi:hypothetical protein
MLRDVEHGDTFPSTIVAGRLAAKRQPNAGGSIAVSPAPGNIPCHCREQVRLRAGVRRGDRSEVQGTQRVKVGIVLGYFPAGGEEFEGFPERGSRQFDLVVGGVEAGQVVEGKAP